MHVFTVYTAIIHNYINFTCQTYCNSYMHIYTRKHCQELHSYIANCIINNYAPEHEVTTDVKGLAQGI